MLLCCRLLEFYKKLEGDNFRFLLTGGVSIGNKLPDTPKNSSWLSEKMWGEICRLSELKDFPDFYKHFYDD